MLGTGAATSPSTTCVTQHGVERPDEDEKFCSSGCANGVTLAGPASAGLITFDFTGGGPNGTSVVRTVNNVKLTVTADKTNSGSGPFTVTWNKNGLGVAPRTAESSGPMRCHLRMSERS